MPTVSYQLIKASTSFVRPADTIAYSIGDAVTDSTSTPSIFSIDLAPYGLVNGQGIEIRKVAVVSSVKQSTLPLFNLYLSGITFSPTADNAALDIADSVQENGGSWIILDTQNYTASNSRVSKIGVSIPMVIGSDIKIYGTIQAANGYTPVSGEKFTIIIWFAAL